MKLLAACITVLCLLLPARAATADQITVTGALTMTGNSGSFSLTGDRRGFTFAAEVFGPLGTFEPCLPCTPGGPISLLALWGGSFATTAATTIDGLSFPFVSGTIPNAPSAEVRFTGSSVAPLTGTIATFEAPFNFSGHLVDTAFPARFERADLVGSGIATITLARPNESLPWSRRSIVYQLDPVEPIPEPGTLLLVGSGIALILRRRFHFAPH